MPQSDSSQIESLDEELVAYLDGQLDPESARHVEQRLASEETARRRLQQLAQSWDMLDQLPHAVADGVAWALCARLARDLPHRHAGLSGARADR